MGPVFLQSLWRSCSTYFWAKFRTNCDWRCYNEPLHEILLNLDGQGVENVADTAEILRHPHVDEHYFAEYPQLPEGGVPLFRKRFTAENFYLHPQSADEELAAYLGSLFAHAAQNMQRPFLQPNRGLLRAEWMQKSFGGVHLYLNRDIEELLRSYFSFGGNDSYFLQNFATIIGQNANAPFFSELAALKGLKPFSGRTYVEEREHFGRMTADWQRQDFSDIVAFIWVTGLAQASRYAGGLIEVARLRDNEYRHALRASLLNLTGSDMDFFDFNPPASGKAGDVALSEPARAIIRRAVETLGPDWGRLEKLGMAEPTKRFIGTIL